MSILNTSVSGMLANTDWLTTIAQNVANANTPGYKNVDTSFSALVDKSTDFQSQFAGVMARPTALNALQGQIQQSTTTTDLAVQGDGFFIVQNSGGDTYLTRNGSFVPDANGDLVNGAGYYLMGQPYAGGSGTPNSLATLSKVNITNAADTAIPSTSATLIANLPSTATAVTGTLPSANSLHSQFTSQTSMVAYDDLGNAHSLNLYFTKTGANTWEADAYDAAGATNGGFPYSSSALATQTLTFDPTTGALTSGSPLTLTVPGGKTLSISMTQTTQLASSFAVNSATINGSAPSSLTDVSIGANGTLSFNYGNGAVTPAYTIPLAKVQAASNLTPYPGGAFLANAESGAPQIGQPNTGGLGSINSSALEGSTVDLATELTEMVEAQSSYEANSKVFQAGAKILDVLNNIQA